MSDDSAWRLATSAVHLLHRASQKADTVFLRTAGASLTPRQFIILAAAGEKPGVSQTAIVESTGIDKSTVAELTQRLIKRGLLQRRRMRKDARAYAVRPTSEGKEVLRKLLPAARDADKAVLADTGPQLIKLLETVITAPGGR